MILDILENSSRYLPLNKGFIKAFEFLNRPDIETLETGKHEIDGENVFAIVAREQGREKELAQLEIHKNYIDIQFVISGTDTMGWRNLSSCSEPADQYNPEYDLQFYKDQPHAWLATVEGSYAIFFPEDAHMPLISDDFIHKVIVKVAVNQY